MRNTQESGQILRSKNRPRRTLRSGRGSRTNSNTSHQIPERVIEADSARARMGAGPEIGPTDPTGRRSGRDHSSLQWLGPRRSQHHFRNLPALAASNMTEVRSFPKTTDTVRALIVDASYSPNPLIVFLLP